MASLQTDEKVLRGMTSNARAFEGNHLEKLWRENQDAKQRQRHLHRREERTKRARFGGPTISKNFSVAEKGWTPL